MVTHSSHGHSHGHTFLTRSHIPHMVTHSSRGHTFLTRSHSSHGHTFLTRSHIPHTVTHSPHGHTFFTRSHIRLTVTHSSLHGGLFLFLRSPLYTTYFILEFLSTSFIQCRTNTNFPSRYTTSLSTKMAPKWHQNGARDKLNLKH